MWKEFKEFALKGNVVDMAIGVVVGSAFSKIVTSIVNDIIMPLVGVITGGLDFSAAQIVLKGDSALKYGSFIQNVIDFLIIAVTLFFVVKTINVVKKKCEKPAEPVEEKPAEPTEKEILAEIRDLLKK
ncbi:MAG: large-conductance mechanosensitive channel protein MscL [Clostridia bacterium]|nr:large-conductance mechanosensitive channel protein MscL [Clostridia bacterium]